METFELGSLAEWLQALLSVPLGIFALFLSWQANRTSAQIRESEEQRASQGEQREKERDERIEAKERQRDEAERRREDRALQEVLRLRAEAISAWWVVNPEDPTEWGLIVRNVSRSVLYDVLISTTNLKHNPTAKITALPPGDYYVPCKWTYFERPIPVESAYKYAPVVNKSTHEIAGIRYRDLIGAIWEWKPMQGIRQVD